MSLVDADRPSPAHPFALVLSGSGRYADPWHPFDETTPRVVELLAARGLGARVETDIDEVLAAWAAGAEDGSQAPALVVVNVGLPRDGGPSPADGAASAGLRALLSADIPLLALHVSATSFADSPEWEAAIGGRWVRGVTMHPDFGRASVTVVHGAHPIVDGAGDRSALDDFEVDDERYSWLRVSPHVSVLATHEHDDVDQPFIWAHERGAHGTRTVYDGLGHNGRSFDSAGHRALLDAAIDWLLEDARR